jgi:carbon starvation protein
MGAFGNQRGKTLMTKPSVPLGMILVTLLGILAGQMTYKWRRDILLTTVVTVGLSFVGIWLGTQAGVVNFFNNLVGRPKSPVLFGTATRARFIGTLLVLLFCYLGSVLPIWSWAQPVNYVSFWIIGLGMLGGVLGMLIWRPSMGNFPAFTQWTIGPGPLWPMLFVTIACGASSHWHSLLSTSGTARQLEHESDALPIGGGAMFLEMVLAVISLLCATAAFGGLEGYKAAGGAGAALAVFAEGLSRFLNHVGIPHDFGVAYASVFLTIMQLVVRFMRVASAELLGEKVPHDRV